MQIIDDFTYEEYLELKQNWLDKYSTTWQICGHVLEDNAKILVQECEDMIVDHKTSVEHNNEYLILNQNTVNEYCIKHPNPKIQNSTAVCYWQLDVSKLLEDSKNLDMLPNESQGI